jgi:hypothetical protein
MKDAAATDRLLGEAIAALDRAAAEPSDQLTESAGEALRAITRLRDALIDRRRAEPGGDPRTHQQLDATNAALSLVSGVAYPAGKLDRAGLLQARDVLAQVRSTIGG